MDAVSWTTPKVDTPTAAGDFDEGPGRIERSVARSFSRAADDWVSSRSIASRPTDVAPTAERSFRATFVPPKVDGEHVPAYHLAGPRRASESMPPAEPAPRR
jgi:hypothetical protein